ncbi:unnamed protein product [Moneuplotes crassus]|uniref:LITAF domain-containing protein n=1 Tax=Euplotes crassus TaxID=5936 RepID=A0AAD2D6H3_EUPCR|nr:unnamed protein product [Moneuplotes crassus]
MKSIDSSYEKGNTTTFHLTTGKKDTYESSKPVNPYHDPAEEKVMKIFRTFMDSSPRKDDKKEANKGTKGGDSPKKISINEKIQRSYKYDKKEYVHYNYFKKTLQPVEIDCHFCKKKIKTQVQRRCNLKQVGYCSLLALAGGICMFLPFCMPQCYTVRHYCPKCTRYLGRN